MSEKAPNTEGFTTINEFGKAYHSLAPCEMSLAGIDFRKLLILEGFKKFLADRYANEQIPDNVIDHIFEKSMSNTKTVDFDRVAERFANYMDVTNAGFFAGLLVGKQQSS